MDAPGLALGIAGVLGGEDGGDFGFDAGFLDLAGQGQLGDEEAAGLVEEAAFAEAEVFFG